MTTPTGAEVMAQFLPQSPFVAKLGIVAEILDGDEVRLRMRGIRPMSRSATWCTAVPSPHSPT
jgi:hypothetical protein